MELNPIKQPPLRVFEGFGGVGAFTLALERLNLPHVIVGFSEIETSTVQVYTALHNLPLTKNYGDITKINFKDLPDFDAYFHGSPCFVGHELVNTEHGLKPIKDICIGDYVKSHDGTYNKVTHLMVSEVNCLTDVKSSVTHNITSTDNHPFYVLRNDKKEYIETKDLKLTDYLIVPINKQANSIETLYELDPTYRCLPLNKPEFWYLIGKCLVDGKLPYDEFLDLIYEVTPRDYEKNIVINILIKFCIFIKNGIPKAILDLDSEYLNELLKGVLTTSYTIGNQVRVLHSNKAVIYSLAELVLKLYKKPYTISKNAIGSTITPATIGDALLRDVYTLAWELTDLENTEPTVYTDTENLYSKIMYVTSTTTCPTTVYNLEVENTHTYCVNNIAVHNCQSFSNLGTNAGGDEFSGTVSSLLWNSVQLIKTKRPKYVVWENVKGVLSKQHVHNFHAYIETLTNEGYISFYHVITPTDVNVPQSRPRVFCVSMLEEYAQDYTFPLPQTLTRELTDVLEPDPDQKYYLTEQEKNYKLTDFRLRVRMTAIDPKVALCLITANNGTMVTQNGKLRQLTPLECWRLMSFTDEEFYLAKETLINYYGHDNVDIHLYRMAGNSIVVDVAKGVLEQLLINLN